MEYVDKNPKKIESITVGISSIDLHLFDNQIGLLSITTEQANLEFEQKLIFNNLAPSEYPLYIGGDNSSTVQQAGMLPTLVSVSGDMKTGRGARTIEERFVSVDLIGQRDSDILFMSKIIRDLLAPLQLKDRKGYPA